MARNSPVRICAIKHSASRDPKFHHAEMLAGAGRSTRASLASLSSGCFFRRLAIILWERFCLFFRVLYD